MSSTEQVLGHHLECFGKGDLDGIMDDFADDAIVVGPEGLLRGREAIRGLFATLLPMFPAGETKLELQQNVVDGDLAYIVWTADSPKVNVPMGSDTFIVRNGKIVQQTLAAVINPK